MVDKKLFDEITDWSRIDYICIKSKMRSLDTSVYYLDGHPMFEKRYRVVIWNSWILSEKLKDMEPLKK